MKKVRTCIIAAALTTAVLTVPAGAVSINAVIVPGSEQIECGNGINSCKLDLSELLSNCPDSSLSAFLSNCPNSVLTEFASNCPNSSLSDWLNTFLPGQVPSEPGNNTPWPDQTPDVPDDNQTAPGDEDTLSAYEAEVVRLVNDARRENGLQPLTASEELSNIARIKSQDMVDQHYFSHTSPTYGTPFQMLTSFGVTYRSAGENIAYGQRTPQEVVSTWMNSPGHRANILNASYTEIGVGYVASGNYWTQLFIG